MGYFPAKSAVSQPTCKVRDTNWRRILAKSVSDEWSPETLHGIVSMMAATLLSLKGHFCPSFTPNQEKIPLRTKNRMVQPDSLNMGVNASPVAARQDPASLEVPEDRREAWAERVAIMVTDGGVW